ncbi:MAG: hypothetical protein EHM23_28035 [Acidobacteria bacterium]|nr:MAG: hypothetical protein EHM23_28035 [Acidobacteriota bacterium]
MMRRIPVFFAVLLLVLAVSTASGQDLRRTVFPQLGIGGGWSCDFFVNNQAFTAVSGVKISFFDDNGAALVVQANPGGSGSTFTFNLAAGETYVIRASGGATTVSGYAELTALKGSPIRATMVVRLAPGGQTSTQLGVSEQFIFSHYSFAAEVGPGVDTGIALVNPFAILPLDVVLSLINKDGTVQATKTFTLAAGQHFSQFLGGNSGIFPGISFVGTVSLSAPDWFGLLALRLEGGALGSVSVNEGAVLAPFFVNQQATSEVEANDSTTAAQQLPALPAVVSGVISTKDDIDYFRFTGRTGDIVNVLVELPTGSELDSEVFLLNSAGDTIAWNDQNGLGGPFSAETDLPQYASFLTGIIPADGTYYLKLWDWVGEFGGSTFTYRLHVSTKTP